MGRQTTWAPCWRVLLPSLDHLWSRATWRGSLGRGREGRLARWQWPGPGMQALLVGPCRPLQYSQQCVLVCRQGGDCLCARVWLNLKVPRKQSPCEGERLARNHTWHILLGRVGQPSGPATISHKPFPVLVYTDIEAVVESPGAGGEGRRAKSMAALPVPWASQLGTYRHMTRL